MDASVAKAWAGVRFVLLAGSVLLVGAEAARAAAVSAAYNTIQGGSNHMGLPGTVVPITPGTPDFGTLGLAAPGSGTSSVTTPFAYPAGAPNPGNNVQMYGDGISSITNLGAGSFQVELTLTNFTIDQPTPLVSDEYVYLNVWQTFTGLGLPTNTTWSTAGTISVTGLWTAGPGGFVSIEPTAVVYDTSASNWIQASPFFGSPHSGPGAGPIAASQLVNPLAPYVTGGQLEVGMQAILLLSDIAGAGGNSMNLPSSLHLSLTLTPVPVPEPSSLVMACLALAGGAAAVARRSRLKRRAG